MKRLAVTLDQLASRANLALATWKAARSKRDRPAVAAWLARLDDNLAQLSQDILAHRSPQGRASQFVVHDPKRRTITAACFADRVLHHAILNLTEPRFEQALAPGVFACRVGGGVHKAVAAVQMGLQRQPWVVQVDVDGYFPSIDHAVLLQQLRRRFKGDDFLALLERILDAGAVRPGCGLPIGALTSQHFANGYLGTADRLLAEQAGVQGVVRYMDDMVWFCSSRAAADASLAALRQHLRDDLHLRLKDKVIIRPSAQGLRFCGYRIKPDPNNPLRALRGGSWNNHPGNARAAYRNDNHRDNDWHNNGFRLALSSRVHGCAPPTRPCPDPVRHVRRRANGKGPGVWVGGKVDASSRKLPGCSVPRASTQRAVHVV